MEHLRMGAEFGIIGCHFYGELAPEKLHPNRRDASVQSKLVKSSNNFFLNFFTLSTYFRTT